MTRQPRDGRTQQPHSGVPGKIPAWLPLTISRGMNRMYVYTLVWFSCGGVFRSDGTPQQLVIYIDSYDVIRGKRKSSATNQWEDLISLQNGRFIANGSRSDGGGLGAIGLAAVYSADFRSGPGARVFFHAQSDDEADASYVQELIWDQRRDAWSLGSRLRDPAPDSQLAVAVDDRTLRLFYCSGNRTLQESWMNLTDARQSYMRGTLVIRTRSRQ